MGLVGQPARAFVVDETSGLRIVDVADATRPAAWPMWVSTTDVRDAALEGSRAYLLMGNRVAVAQVADPAQPVLLGQLELDGAGTALVAADHFVYVGLAGGDVQVIDATDPAQPRAAGRLPAGETVGDVSAIAAADDHIWYATTWGGIFGADLADPARPVPVARLFEDAQGLDVVLDGNRLYAALGAGGPRHR